MGGVMRMGDEDGDEVGVDMGKVSNEIDQL